MVIGVIAVALANLYMLVLARRWGVEPTGWYRAGLHWQDGVVGLALGLFGFVVSFLDALLKAMLNLSRGPIGGFLSQLHWTSRLDVVLPPSGIQGLDDLRMGLFGNLLLGAVASLMTASVVKGLLPRAKSGGHASARH